MKVVSICVDDHANFMYNHHIGLGMNRVDSYCYKLNHHPFKYEREATLITLEGLKELKADVFIIFHSDYELRPYINGPVVYYHTGTKFRQNSANIIYHTDDAIMSLIALPEFHNIGLKNQKYLIGSVEQHHTNRYANGNVFGHFPSNPSVKGTGQILEWFDSVGVDYKVDATTMPYPMHIKRLDDCDIYVELFNPHQGKKVYGSFGMTALEAAQLGKVVITQNLTGMNLYMNTYGECELEIGNTAEQFKQLIRKYKDADVQEKSERTIQWFNEKHSQRATGLRLKRLLERV